MFNGKSMPYYEMIVNNCIVLFVLIYLDKRKEETLDIGTYKKRSLSSHSKSTNEWVKPKIDQNIQLIPIEFNCIASIDVKSRLREVL